MTSFLAFLITVITSYQAPSNLVKDALKTALGEVCHTMIWFNTALRLTRIEIEVGSSDFTPSKCVSGQNLKAMVMLSQ